MNGGPHVLALIASQAARGSTSPARVSSSEIRGATLISPDLPFWHRLLRSLGPGLLVAVGYMDPGNWATDIEAGSRYGYDLLFVILLCGFSAMLLQWLAMRLGLVARRDLAHMARERYSRVTCRTLWLLAELAIIATDIAEVLGSALAFNLLLGVPLWAGILLTGLDTLLILGLQGRGFRQLEAIILGLILTIALCFAVQLAMTGLSFNALLVGAMPKAMIFEEPYALYLAVGILGATVMPHNLYLHSAVVQTRLASADEGSIRSALRFATIDILLALLLATLVNAAILALSGSAFHGNGHRAVTEIAEAHRLLAPVTGTAFAPLLFGVALLAAGQSATFTGTVAGQVILEGFMDLKIPWWQRRLITRSLALTPALIGILWLGDHAVGRLLVLTQVILSLQLPFAIYPLIRFTSSRSVMGSFATTRPLRSAAWTMFAVIVAANFWLVMRWIG